MKPFSLRSVLALIGIGLAIWLTVMLYSVGGWRRSDFLGRHYSGVIKDIIKRPLRRGCPDVLIGNEWVLFILDEQKVFEHIQIGDSIIKQAGSEKIVIYKKDSLGKFLAKEF